MGTDRSTGYRSRDSEEGRGGRGDRDRDDSRSSRDSGGRDRERSRDEGRGSSRGRDRGDEDRGGRDRGGRESSRSSFRYEQRDGDNLRKRSQASGGDFDKIMQDGVKMYKLRDGDNRLRILPPTWAKPVHFGFDAYVHYGVGPDHQAYLDLDKMKDQPDPITEAYDKERRRDNPDEEYVRELKSRQRVLYYVIDRDEEKAGVQCFSAPWTLDKDLTKVCQDKGTGEVLNIDDPENGYDIEFTKEGSGKKTKYSGVAVARRSSPLGDDRWLDWAVEHPIPDMLQFFDYDHIAKVFSGRGEHKEKDRDRGDDRDTGRGRDRDDEPRPTDRDDGSRRGSDRDAPGSRSRDSGRGRDEAPKEPELSWESVHDMTKRELEDLIDQERLDINPDEAKDVDDLADWVCDELKLEKAPAPRSRPRDDDRDAAPRDGGRNRVTVADDGDDVASRMRDLRNRRERS